jgi:hypothetical protein
LFWKTEKQGCSGALEKADETTP